MYETRIIIPSRRGKGLADIAVEDKKPSGLDKAVSIIIDAAVVVVILAFLYIAVEPLIGGGESYSAFEATASELAASIRFFVAGKQKQPGYELLEIADVPKDAWDNNFIYDSFWERIVSRGPDGLLHTKLPGVPIARDGVENDDMIYYCNSYGRLWYSFKGDDGDCIGVMRADGTGNRTLSVATENKRDLRYPVLSPDGKNLAFSVLSGGGEWQIAVSAPDGTAVNFVPAIGDSRWPSWNVKGTKVFYESKRAGDDGILAHSIFSYDFGTDSESRVFSGRGSYRNPLLHPHLKNVLAYVYIKKGQRLPRICLMNNEDADSRDYISRERIPQKSPSWFPNRMELAYIARANDGLQAFSMNVSSREAVAITAVTGDPQLITCAPIGRRVAVVTEENNLYKIVVIDLDSGIKALVYESRNKLYSLSWSY